MNIGMQHNQGIVIAHKTKSGAAVSALVIPYLKRRRGADVTPARPAHHCNASTVINTFNSGVDFSSGPKFPYG